MQRSRIRPGVVLLMIGAVLPLACTASDESGNSGTGADTSTQAPVTGAPGRPGEGFIALDPLVDRAAHTATRLPDGRVLVVGGCVVDGCSEATDTTEIFDPAAGRFVEGPNVAVPRAGHTATALANGDVLLVGGYSGEGQPPLTLAELYVVASGEFVAAGELAFGRGGHMAAALPGGEVLIAGGSVSRRTITETAELWDAAGRSFRSAGSMSNPRSAATATTLADGSVLVVGGESTPGTGVDSTEIYRPDSDKWSAGPSLTEPRFKHAAVSLSDASVLIVGGTTDDETLLAGIERYDGTEFERVASMAEGRYKFGDAVAALPDGRIAIMGGGRTGESFDPLTGLSATLAGPSASRSSFSTATLLDDGSVLVVGGYDDRIDILRRAYLVESP